MDVRVDSEHFSGPLAPLGDGAFTVAIGGIAVRIKGLSEPLFQASMERYKRFLSTEPPLHTVHVSPGLSHYLDPAPDSIMRMEENQTSRGRILVSHTFAAMRFWKDEPAILRVSAEHPLQYSAGAVENYLRWTIADLVLDRGSFILHSAGLVREGRAYLFFGHSGAGKSTVTAMSVEALGALPLSDDLVLISQEGGEVRAETTPFWGTMPQQVKKRGSYPVAGLFHLRQSREVKVTPVSPALAVGMVLSCCPFVGNAQRRIMQLVPLVENLCGKVPAQELYFRKEPSFWDVVMTQEVRG